MSVWPGAATWVNAPLAKVDLDKQSAALIWLKAALDVITNSTDSDTGTATLLQIVRPGATDHAFDTRLAADANPRLSIRANGDIALGDGTGAPTVAWSLTNGALQAQRVIQATQLTKLFTKSGVINDTDIPGTFTGSGTGMIGVDVTNNRLYVRVGATWRFVALT